MKRLVFGVIFLVLGIGFYVYNIEEILIGEQVRLAEDRYQDELQFNEVRALVNKANTIEELDQVLKVVDLDKDKLLPIIGLKRSLLLFNEAEGHLMKAVEIENALTDDSKQNLHPLTVKELNKAIQLYETARKEVEQIKEQKNLTFDYQLNYLKGEIYFRHLEIMATQETALEMFNQTVTYYKYALRHKPSDVNTVVNIEILIKNQNKLLADASNPNGKKKTMLNSKKFGVNKSSGN